MWPLCDACTVGLFEYLSTLKLTCAQSGRVSGLEKKTDPASSARSDKKGLKDNDNRLLGIVHQFWRGIILYRRGIILLVLLIIQPLIITLYRFPVKKHRNRLVFRVKIAIF